MKTKYIYYTLLLSFIVSVTGCDINEIDNVVVNPQATFSSESKSITIDSDDVTYILTVELSELFTADKLVNVSVSDASTAGNREYNFTGNVVVKSGETSASTPITFNFDAIPSDIPKTLILNIEGTNEEIRIEYTKICQSNDVNLTILFDNYPQETSWEITDSSGSTVESGGTYPGQGGETLSLDFTLPNGTYTFTINDAFSDGICCSFGQGSYSLSKPFCSEVLASGGEFGSSESTTFSVP